MLANKFSNCFQLCRVQSNLLRMNPQLAAIYNYQQAVAANMNPQGDHILAGGQSDPFYIGNQNSVHARNFTYDEKGLYLKKLLI